MDMDKARELAAFIGALSVAVSGALADNVLDLDETGKLVALAVTGAATVYAFFRVPNKAK